MFLNGYNVTSCLIIWRKRKRMEEKRKKKFGGVNRKNFEE